jgi:hypothetical protein
MTSRSDMGRKLCVTPALSPHPRAFVWHPRSTTWTIILGRVLLKGHQSKCWGNVCSTPEGGREASALKESAKCDTGLARTRRIKGHSWPCLLFWRWTRMIHASGSIALDPRRCSHLGALQHFSLFSADPRSLRLPSSVRHGLGRDGNWQDRKHHSHPLS